MRTKRSIADRFWPKVNKNGPTMPHMESQCWVWTAARLGTFGYGAIGAGGHTGRPLPAHRVSWEIHNGPVPDGLLVLHRCDNPPCVNPDHLFLGTHADNVRDCHEKGRNGTPPVIAGERQHLAVLTDNKVREARARSVAGEPHASIAADLGVTLSTASKAICGDSWAHITEPPPVPRFRRGPRVERDGRVVPVEEVKP